MWNKEVWINGEYAGEQVDGPFSVVYGDSVAIADDLWCDFDYDWSLWEEWEPAVLELGEDTISSSDGSWTWDGELGWLEWYGDYVPAETSVHLERTFFVADQGWEATTISGFTDFGPLQWELPLTLEEGQPR